MALWGTHLTHRSLTGSFRTGVVPAPGASQHSLECGPRGPSPFGNCIVNRLF